jgi:hypothetical protein
MVGSFLKNSPHFSKTPPNIKKGDTGMHKQYEIVIRGHLTLQWSVMFDGMEITCLPDGNTCITGSLPDQSALYGLMNHLRDLGITLIRVNLVEPKGEE